MVRSSVVSLLMRFRNNRDAPRYPLHPSSEPLGMTISDWFVITSGCSLCLSIMNIAPFLAWIGVIPVGLTFAVLVRQTKYRRSIDPSEYPILFVTALAFALAAPNVDTTLNWLSLLIYGQPLESWTLWRRVLAGLALILAAILIMPMSRLPSSAAKSVLATLALVIILWGPMSVFPVEFDPIWFVTIDVPLTLRDVFLMEFRDAIHRTPMLICWVYLTAISLRSLRVHSRPWTSFAGTFLALLLLLALVVMDAYELFGRDDLWPISWLVRPIWFSIVSLITWKLIRYWQPFLSDQSAFRSNATPNTD